MQVLGIDPSLTSTGLAGDTWAVTIKPKSKGDARLVEIVDMLSPFVRSADFVVMEDLPTHAKSAGLTGRAQGVIRYVLQVNNVPYVAISPASIKKWATNKGNADKQAMVDAWNEAHPERQYTVKQNDMVDAAWMQELGEFLLGQKGYEYPEFEWRNAAMEQWLENEVVQSVKGRLQ